MHYFISGQMHINECFGEMGLVDGLPRVSHAIADSDCTLNVINKQDFLALCCHALWQMFLTDLSGLQDKYNHLMGSGLIMPAYAEET